jgi:thymidylate synthase (FAD)
MLVRKGHHAMIEFGDIMVKFVTNRGVTHELVRHRHCSFAQESTRYVKYYGQMEFIKPVWCQDHLLGTWSEQSPVVPDAPPAEQLWLSAMGRAEKEYKTLLQNGWKAQQAREIT